MQLERVVRVAHAVVGNKGPENVAAVETLALKHAAYKQVLQAGRQLGTKNGSENDKKKVLKLRL